MKSDAYVAFGGYGFNILWIHGLLIDLMDYESDEGPSCCDGRALGCCNPTGPDRRTGREKVQFRLVECGMGRYEHATENMYRDKDASV